MIKTIKEMKEFKLFQKFKQICEAEDKAKLKRNESRFRANESDEEIDAKTMRDLKHQGGYVGLDGEVVDLSESKTTLRKYRRVNESSSKTSTNKFRNK